VCSDIKIATAQSPKDISELASEVGLLPDEVDFYGKKKAKVSLKVLDRLADQQNGNYVIVTGSVSVLLDQVVGSRGYAQLSVGFISHQEVSGVM